jgi:hypothetical protein
MMQTNLTLLLLEPRIQKSQQCHVVVAKLIRTVTRRHLNQHVTRTSVNAHLPEDVWDKKHHLQLISLLIYSLYIINYCLRRLAIFYMYLVYGASLFWLLWCALRIKSIVSFFFFFFAIIDELQEPLQFDVMHAK